MDEVRRYVNLAFVLGGIAMSWFLMNIAAWVMSYIPAPGLDANLLGEQVTVSTVVGVVLAFITTIVLWKTPKVYQGALSVAREMKKVTWPTWDETKHAMKVVIVTTCIIAMILFCFDFVAKELTDLILGIR